MKKITLLLISFFLCNGFLSAQFRINNDKRLHQTGKQDQKLDWGFSLGLNSLNYKLTPSKSGYNNIGISKRNKITVLSDTKMGFNVGALSIYRFNEHFSIQFEPTVYFTQRSLNFTHITDKESKIEVKSTYIDLPVFINYHGVRWRNTQPYIQIGAGYSRNIQSNEDKTDDLSTGIFRAKTNNFNFQAEIGITLILEYFRLTPAIRYIQFFDNEILDDNPGTSNQWAGSIEELSTRGIAFVLKFQ